MTARDAAMQVLREEVWQTTGKTPAATVSARLCSDIKKNGDKSPFALVAHGIGIMRQSLSIIELDEVQEGNKP